MSSSGTNHQQHQQQNQATTSNSNLLSPNTALGADQVAAGAGQRRKSTLSGNGFFIDYSCTRRRSSAAVRQVHSGGGYVSPAAVAGGGRIGGGSFCAGSQPSSPRSRAHSRAGTAASGATLLDANSTRLNSSSTLLVPPLYAPSALAGSRKTSIFDPAGHSLNAAHLRTMRRKSTMVTSMPVFDSGSLPVTTAASDTTTSKMLSLAKTVARAGSQSAADQRHLLRKSQLVPVIGCSPTSIRASLAALDETRRYEKLLKKLKRHEKSRLKRDKKLQKRRREAAALAAAAEQDEPQPPANLSFRRKSLRAIKDAASLLGQNKRRQREQEEDQEENLSVSSMSLSHAFDQTSNFELMSSARSSRSSSIGCTSLNCSAASDNNSEDDDDDERYELNNDELFLDDNTMVDFNNQELPSGDASNRQQQSGGGSNLAATPTRRTKSANGAKSPSSTSANLVKFAMRRLTGSTRRAAKRYHQRQASGGGGDLASGGTGQQNADYWHYYYYLRENSLDAIDDLPISGYGGCEGSNLDGGGGSGSATILSDAERRIRLHMNYSLARIQILNDCGRSTTTAKVSSSSGGGGGGGAGSQAATEMSPVEAEAIGSQGVQELGDHYEDDEEDDGQGAEHLFDQASEVSLSLSTSSSSSSTGSTCTQQASLDGPATGVAASTAGQQHGHVDGSSGSRSTSPTTTTTTTTTSGPAANSDDPGESMSLSSGSRSSLNVNSIEWRQSQRRRQQSMSSQSVAAAQKSASQVNGGAGSSGLHKRQLSQRAGGREGGAIRQPKQHQHQHRDPVGVGNLADDECTSVECLMDRNRLSPSPMRPKSADTSGGVSIGRSGASSAATGRKHRSASGELLAGTESNLKQLQRQQQPAIGAANQRRSASFRSHTNRRQQQPQQSAVGVSDEPELDDFERFRRAHRPGYNQNGEQQQPVVATGQGGRGRQIRSSGLSQARPARGSSSCNLAASRLAVASSASSMAVAAGSGSGRMSSRTSMSWDTLASAWYEQDEQPPVEHSVNIMEQPPSAVKRTSSARLSSRQRERLQIGSYSNPTRFNHDHQQQHQQRLPLLDSVEANLQPVSGNGGGGGSRGRTGLSVRNQRRDNYDVYLNDSRLGCGGGSSCVGGGIGGGGGAHPPIISPDGRALSQASIVNLGLVTGNAGSGLADDGRSWQVAQVVQPHSQRLLVSSSEGQQRSGSLRVARSRQHQHQQQQPNEVLDHHRRQDNFERLAATHQDSGGSVFGQPNIAAVVGSRSNENGARLEPIGQEHDHHGHRVRAYSTGASTSANLAAANRKQLRGNQLSGGQDKINHDDQQQKQPLGEQGHHQKQQQQQQTNKKALERDFQLLAKNSFTCMIIGSRQTGKRTIVKCFVKLVNEFRLAADEYRKEKILTKLMDCRGRLQMLAKQQAEQEEKEKTERQQLLANMGRRRSRVNSWLGGKLLTHLPAGGKLRLHSLVPSPAPPSASSLSINPPQQQQHLRRHTAVGPAGGFNLCGGSEEEVPSHEGPSAGQQTMLSRDGIGRHSTKERRRPTAEFLLPDAAGRLSCCNKSDFNINYLDTQESGSSEQEPPAGSEYIVMSQLQVPTTGGQPLQSRSLTSSTSSLCKPPSAANLAGGSSSQLAGEGRSRQQQTRVSIQTDYSNLRRPSTQSRTNNRKPHHHHHHHQSAAEMQMRKHARHQTTVSLKEINRRRIRVRFSTRRQLSDKYLSGNHHHFINNNINNNNRNNKQETIESSSTSSNNGNIDAGDDDGDLLAHHAQLKLPDSIMVVYSVNDRESFEYAKSLIGQLRSIRDKQDILLPIILVANKIDLERAKVVRPEEGRALAKRNECKYMEISCTVGFKLDNLLVGLRTQLVLKHHTTLNAVLKGKLAPAMSNQRQDNNNKHPATSRDHHHRKVQKENSNKSKSNNILVRFYKRYMMDDCGQDFDCDNFSKL